MIVQFVQFETSLGEDEIMAVAMARESRYAAIPGLVQKYYLKLNKPNHFGGILIWASREAMAAFADTDLARTIPSAYKVIGAPDIDIHELLFPLRQEVAYGQKLDAV
jgi:heme-degrading monooxygenase HmoA